MSRGKRGKGSLPALPAGEFAAAAVEAGGEGKREAIAWLMAAVTLADGGDQDALKQVKAAFDAVPRLWETFFPTLRDTAEASMLDAMLGRDRQLAAREATRRQLDRLRAELAGENPTPLERLLVERVALCWLASMHTDAVLAQQTAAGCSAAVAEYHQRRAEGAQRRFLAAAKMLATVRRLGLPAVQLNVAEKQINVAR